MPIENRDLKPGTKLAAWYKGKDYSAEVVETKEGLRYRLEDGREFKSPSSAGSAVMGGHACNGWRFWSLAGEAEPKAPKKEPKKNGKRSPRRTAAFEQLEDGRAFCSACLEAFQVADDQEPEECPRGHKADGSQAQL